jgi:hypothetical protein
MRYSYIRESPDAEFHKIFIERRDLGKATRLPPTSGIGGKITSWLMAVAGWIGFEASR